MEEFEFQNFEQESSGPGIDFKKLLKGIWKRKLLIVILALATAVPFYVRADKQIPIYRCKVLLRVDQPGENSVYFSGMRQIEMKSRSFANRIAAKAGLAVVMRDSLLKNPTDVFEELETTFEPVEGLYKIRVTQGGSYFLEYLLGGSEIVIDSCSVWEAVDESRDVNGLKFRLRPSFVDLGREVLFQVRPFNKASNEVMYGVSVTFNRSETVMGLEIEGSDPDLLAPKLNKLADVYIQEIHALAAKDQLSYRTKLEEQLKSAEERVKKLEAEFRAFNSKYPLSLEAKKNEIESAMRFNERDIRTLPIQQQQLADLIARLDKKDIALDEAKYRRIIIHQIANFAPMKDEPTLNILRETLLEKEREYDEYMRNYGPGNPDLHAVEKEIAEIQKQIVEFASRYRNTLVKQEKELIAKREELEAQLRELPYDEQRKSELERNKKIVDELHTRLYQKMQELEVNEAVQSPGIELIEPAVRPAHPINPGKKTSVLLGSVLGALLGIIVSIVIDLLDSRLRTIDEVEKHLKLDVLGAIPIIEFKDIPEYHDFEKIRQIDKQLVTHDYSPTPIGESYRALRTQLMFSKKTGRIQSLVITSFQSGDGKSFTASNLAIIMAQQKTNTLLVDADLRRGVLHNTFSAAKEPGLTNYLTNKATLSSVVQETHIPNLAIISCGSMIPNPSELLGSNQMRRFLEEARRKFDLIIFDTPPLDAATDAVVLGAQANAVAVVVRAGVTKKTTAKQKLEIFETIPANLIGVILNGTEAALVNNSYSYYHY